MEGVSIRTNIKQPETPRRVLEWEAVQTLCMMWLIPSSSHHTTNNKLPISCPLRRSAPRSSPFATEEPHMRSKYSRFQALPSPPLIDDRQTDAVGSFSQPQRLQTRRQCLYTGLR